MFSNRSLTALLSFFLFSFCGVSLHAANASFVVSSGNFNVPANWSTGMVPGPSDTATVANGFVCTVSDARTIAGLTLTGGTLSVDTGGTLTAGTIVFNPNTFSNFITGAGVVTVNGPFDWDTNGSISGSGQLILGSGALMTIPTTQTLDQRTLVIQNGGSLNYNIASVGSFAMNNGASINIQSGGTFTISTSNPITSSGGATIVNAGTINKSSSGTVTTAPTVNNSGTLMIAGTMTFTGGYTDAGGTLALDGGTYSAGSPLNITTGVLSGIGSVAVAVNQTGGKIVPGGSGPGLLDISGDYSQGANGTLEIRISGLTVGEDISRLDVAGTATLGGRLNISLLNGFQPGPSDAFDVLTGMVAVNGAFTGVSSGGSNLGPTYPAGKVTLQRLVNVISVTTLEALPSPARAGGDVTFTATVNNPGGATLNFSWSFGDGTTGSGNPVTKAYNPAQDTTYTVSVTVFDGQQTVQGTGSISVLAPNVGGSGGNISQGKMATNPLSGLGISISSSNAGLLELNISEDTTGALSRAASDVETSFNSDSGSLPTRFGNKVVQKFDKSTVYVASTTVKDSATGATRARARKTVPVSSREVGQANSAIVEPQNRALLTSSMTGKFIFVKEKPDQVTYSGSFEMPAGVDLRESQTLVFAMGNVIDSITLDPKGKGLTPSTLGSIKKLKVKYPRVDRKNPITTAGQIAKITATYFTADLDLKGFDTEGITSRVRDDEAGQKSVQRSIQMAMNLSGVTYEASVPVEFKLSTKSDAGTMKGRRAN